jgi:RHH-type proline utilization regulon transcriptional repressor/proline dehydrogenase/delta 1-pyrroline-5-carboxylate dehydrogenase
VGTVVVRVHPDDGLFDVLARIAGVKISGCELLISLPTGLSNSVTGFLYGKQGKRFVGDAPMIDQTDKDLTAMIEEIQRIRYGAPDRVPDEVFQVAAETGFFISRTKVSMEGRIELLQYFQEQSICSNYHRYGNLGERALLLTK